MLTITPPVGCCIIWRPAHLQPRNAQVKLMPTTVFQPLTEMSSGLARKEAPALFTMMSSRPHSWTARSTIAFTWSSWRTSRATANDRLPTSRTALTTGSRCSSLREQRATSAPARANSIAIDLPMPVPPPVTIAVLPSSEKGDLAMARTIPQGSPPVHWAYGEGRGGALELVTSEPRRWRPGSRDAWDFQSACHPSRDGSSAGASHPPRARPRGEPPSPRAARASPRSPPGGGRGACGGRGGGSLWGGGVIFVVWGGGGGAGRCWRGVA